MFLSEKVTLIKCVALLWGPPTPHVNWGLGSNSKLSHPNNDFVPGKHTSSFRFRSKDAKLIGDQSEYFVSLHKIDTPQPICFK